MLVRSYFLEEHFVISQPALGTNVLEPGTDGVCLGKTGRH